MKTISNSASGGLSLCLAETKSKKFTALFIAAALLVSMSGAFLSMLEFADIPKFNAVPLQWRTIADGFKLICNRLFTVSEKYQAYQYERLTVAAPPNSHNNYIFAALIFIIALAAAYIFIMIKRKSRIMLLCVFLLFTGLQIYLGVFPAPIWNVALYLSLTVAALRASNVSLPLFMFILTAVLTAAYALYPGTSTALDSLNEELRDVFDEKIERPLTTMIDNSEIPYVEQTTNLQVDERTGDTPQNADGISISNEERFSGSRIGTAAPQRLWVLWLILFLFAASFAVWAAAKLKNAAKRKAVFDSPDCTLAINSMFMYIVQWLTEQLVNPPNNTYAGYAAQLAALFTAEYAQEYLGIVDLWQEAVYSDHVMTHDDKQTVRLFLDSTISHMLGNATLLDKLKIRLRLLFY